MFQAGQQIGVYKLVRKLAKGGFGEVWLAEKQSEFVTKRFAVKLPLDEQVDVEAIRQEATLWEQASGHPNVLPLIDADIYDGQVAIVSEYAEDGSLADKLKNSSGGKLPVMEAVEIVIGILSGLEFLHSKNIIHRDIKPANILLQGNTPRLADFGISRAIHTSTITSVVVGTENYMAPEAFEGVRNVQTDIWSVGVVLYRLLTGKLPFPQTNPSEIMYAVLMTPPEPLPAEIPERLREIVFRALEKDRELQGAPPRRYQAAAAMREDLLNFLEMYSQSLSLPEMPVFETPETDDPTRVKLRIPLKQKRGGFNIERILTKKENLPFVVLSVILIFFAIGWLTVRLFSRESAAVDPNISNNAAPMQSNANLNSAGQSNSENDNSSLAPRAVNLVNQGYELFQQKKYDQAIKAYTRAIEINSNDYALYNDRGLVFLAAGRYEKALADFDKSLELNPDASDTYNNRGFAHQNKGNRDKAIADYRRALEINPQNELANRNLNDILK